MAFDIPDAERDPVDIHVGQQLRLHRILAGVSQHELGRRVRLTYQQIQKYERGANRISASRLWRFARELDVPVSQFFQGMEMERGRPRRPKPLLLNEEAADLLRAFQAMPPKRRSAVRALVRKLAEAEAE